jgi:hypothetical protein
MTADLDDKTIAFLKGTCLFFQPWWLEAVAPGCWDVITVRRGEEVAAVLPYTFKRRLNRYLLLEMPPLTPYLGPWLRDSDAKYANRLAEQKDLMCELVEKLPQFAVFNHCFHPSVSNWLPFYWKGFSQATRYTYVLDGFGTKEERWEGLRDNIRTDIRKAQKQVAVEDSQDLARFLQLWRATFNRQGRRTPYGEEVVERIDEACRRNGTRKILLAVDAQGRAHAAVYLVWDACAVYNLMTGGDPELRHSGATSLLLWTAIESALQQRKSFDFEGSVVEPIERFFRAFGGRQTPFFQVSKVNSRIVQTYRTLWKRTHRRT